MKSNLIVGVIATIASYGSLSAEAVRMPMSLWHPPQEPAARPVFQVAPHEPMIDPDARENIPIDTGVAEHLGNTLSEAAVTEYSYLNALELTNFPALQSTLQAVHLDHGKSLQITMELIENFGMDPESMDALIKQIHFSPFTIRALVNAVKQGDVGLFDSATGDKTAAITKVRTILQALHVESEYHHLLYDGALMQTVADNMPLIDELLATWVTDAKIPPIWMRMARKFF